MKEKDKNMMYAIIIIGLLLYANSQGYFENLGNQQASYTQQNAKIQLPCTSVDECNTLLGQAYSPDQIIQLNIVCQNEICQADGEISVSKV